MMKSLGWMGIIYLAQGHVIEAEQETFASMNFATLSSNPSDRATAAVFRGEVMKEMGYYQEARQLFQEAYTIYEALGTQWGRIKTIREISQLSLLLDDYSQAQMCLLQAFQVATQLRLKSHNLHNLLHYSTLLITQGQLERAAEIFALLEKEFADLHQERESVREQLDKLQARLSPERFAASVKAGQQLDWQITVKAVMDELTQPIADPSLSDPLTPREHEILRLIAAGFSNREIAEQLVLTPGTVKWYVSEMFSKLNVNSRTKLVAQARQLNLFA
jgi:ATP/maltotriose-dependent transcriptional regulator MalT